MNFEEIIEETSESDWSQESALARERIFHKRPFSILYDSQAVQTTMIAVPSSSSNAEISRKLDAIAESQNYMISLLRSVDDRLTVLEKTVTGKMPEKAKVQTQSKPLVECKVLPASIRQSISLITGDMEGEEYLELASKLPMSSEEDVEFVESKLKSKSSADAMMRLLAKAKSSKGSVGGVLRCLLKDDVIYHYNLEGRKEKKSLLKLNCIDLIFDVFADRSMKDLHNDLRRYIALSHNRFKQRKHKLRVKLG